jgi:hypothetical protein
VPALQVREGRGSAGATTAAGQMSPRWPMLCPVPYLTRKSGQSLSNNPLCRPATAFWPFDRGRRCHVIRYCCGADRCGTNSSRGGSIGCRSRDRSRPCGVCSTVYRDRHSPDQGHVSAAAVCCKQTVGVQGNWRSCSTSQPVSVRGLGPEQVFMPAAVRGSSLPPRQQQSAAAACLLAYLCL